MKIDSAGTDAAKFTWQVTIRASLAVGKVGKSVLAPHSARLGFARVLDPTYQVGDPGLWLNGWPSLGLVTRLASLLTRLGSSANTVWGKAEAPRYDGIERPRSAV